jgi:threonine dehydrogenase-like Zn-dependent dehydrogenase
MDRMVRLLGLAPEAGAAALAARMGPDVALLPCGQAVALVQPAEAPLRRLFQRRDRAALLRAWPRLRQRLELACRHGAFLACDPLAATCPEAALRELLATQEAALASTLARQGGRQQWDVVLHGAAPDGTAAQAALEAALHPHVVAIAAQAHDLGEHEVGSTIILRDGAVAALQAALDLALPQDLRVELRGPLPALALGALRLLRPGDATGRWSLRGLPERRQPAEVTELWRGLASALQPGTPQLRQAATVEAA